MTVIGNKRTKWFGWLVVYFLTSRLKITYMYSYEDVTNASEGKQNVAFSSTPMAFQRMFDYVKTQAVSLYMELATT